MKTIKFIPAFIMITLFTVTNAFAQNKTDKTGKQGIAVLELFTSEGCSSCPPADELMGKIQNDYKNGQVYVLSYHVDYWDKQGWKDIFSNPDYTKRQYDYSRWLNIESIYTPQVVVNGKTEYIASQGNVVRASIAKALSKPATANLTLKISLKNNVITVNHTASGAPKGSRLFLALVQKSAKSTVKRGENGGRVLSHYQIVRHLHNTNIGTDGKGSTTITLPKDLPKDFEVIGFVQDMNTGAILGADKAVL